MLSSAMGKHEKEIPGFLSGGGEMGQRIREFDWSKTSLGPVKDWPQSLQTCIRIMLTSRQPIWIGWGPELIKLYNDPYIAIVGGKHPHALGKPASVVWKDIWKDIEPMLRQVMEQGEGTYVESQLLIMERNGYPEETYYTFSYSPIPGDDGNTAGMICANTEDTDRIINERQLRTLRDLNKNIDVLQTAEEVFDNALKVIATNTHDFPFAMIYGIDEDGKGAKLMGTAGIELPHPSVPASIDFNKPMIGSRNLFKSVQTNLPVIVNDLRDRLGNMPTGAWQKTASQAYIVPISHSGKNIPYATLVAGINPYSQLNEKYQSFIQLFTDQVAKKIASIHAYDEERKKASALAEIDRAKTVFFSNISHEFRTPLTLLLGPVNEVINDPDTSPVTKIKMETVYRNATRMQKLVNTLLDFSRIEAGRMEPVFQLVDIATYTGELVGSFRSVVENAGMQLIFRYNDINETVYTDPDMWEKIVLNLVSNAFKYSREGKIEVSVMQFDNKIELTVSDTGIGIPANQMDKIFERFHRVENIDGRSQEGTGIGLSMVKELVKLNHGTIRVMSEPGKGSSFIVSIPAGSDHLQNEKIATGTEKITASGYADVFVKEAAMWLPATDTEQAYATSKQTILIADDNSDMRAYMLRLLSDQYNVVTSINGEDAFVKAFQHKPDLILSDIMMPKLDGFGLLKKIRSHSGTRNIPVIFLSARAGEEAKVDGFEAGADDYLVKPFSAKELVARVDSNIKINNARRDTEKELFSFLMKMPFGILIINCPGYTVELTNDLHLQIMQKNREDVIDCPVFEAFPELVEKGARKMLDEICITGKSMSLPEHGTIIKRNGQEAPVILNIVYQPLQHLSGKIDKIMIVVHEVTEQVLAHKKIEESQRELNEMANAVPQLVWIANETGEVIYYNDRISEFEGAVKMKNNNWQWQTIIHQDDLQGTEQAWKTAREEKGIYQVEHRIKNRDGYYRWYLSRAIPQKDKNGNVVKWFGTATDIHASKEQSTWLEEEVEKRTHELNELNNSLQQSNSELQQFAHVASHDLKEPLRKIKMFTSRLTDDRETVISEKSKIYIEKVNGATDRMFTMIEGVLAYSMINASEQKTELVNLNQVLADIESDLELMIARKSALIRSKQLPVLEGAMVLLYQLLYNLIYNALKFSKEDIAPIIEISAVERMEKDRAFAEIVIRDNGIGFEQEYAEKIFNTFSRLNSKDRYEGTGLGLALCKRIVERHSGVIKATSEPGQGAVFSILLPLSQPQKTV